MPRPAANAYRATRGGMQFIMKQNEMYAQNLSAALRLTPKVVKASYAATTLEAAIELTVRDSARAAANWDLSFSGVGMRSEWSPKEYKQFPWIGTRGDKKKGDIHREELLRIKRLTYGYTMPGDYAMPQPGGRLAVKSRMCGFITGARIQLFNPIFSGESKKYAKHAFGYTDSAAMIGKTTSETEAALHANLIPQIVSELRMVAKAAGKAGAFKGICK